MDTCASTEQRVIETDTMLPKSRVEFPTVFFEPLAKGEARVVSVQWFGESDSENLGERQFRFPVTAKVDQLGGHPEQFKVVMIGQIKDWPKKVDVDRLVKAMKGSTPETWVFWLVSAHFPVPASNNRGVIPLSGIFPLNERAKLIDERIGWIKPKKFMNLTIHDKEVEDCRRKFRISTKTKKR